MEMDVHWADNPSTGNALLTLIELGQRARAAASAEELAFLAVNDTHALLAYRQAALWFPVGGVRCLSGVVEVDANVPYVQWLTRLCAALSAAQADAAPRLVSAADAPDEVAREWHEWLPAAVTWIPLPASSAQTSPSGGLLLAADQAPDLAVMPLLQEWRDIWLHTWHARTQVTDQSLPARLRAWWTGSAGQSRWRRPALLALAAAVMLCPVRLTVLAPGELVPANPATIRAPLDGVIDRFAVQPNQSVKAGDPLFAFDQAPLVSRLEVAREGLATAQAEYRQATQAVLGDPRSRPQLAALLGKIAEKEAEAAFLEGQATRSRVLAPRDGIALFDDPTEWSGRPVQTGERIMQIASPSDVEIEAWIPIGDAIPLAPGDTAVHLYLAATPLESVQGTLRYLSHRAVPRPDGTFAYRVRARLANPAGLRIGLKGTAKLVGDWVPLGYWVLRRPLASIRQWIAY